MKSLRALRTFVAELAKTSPRKTAVSIVLMVALSLTEGLGLLLLAPLLDLVGVEEGGRMPKVTGWFEAAFRAVGLEPTLGGVLLLFIAIAALRALLQRWQGSLSASVREGFTSTLRVRVYRGIAGAEWKFLVTRRPAEFAHVLAGELAQIGAAASQLMNLAVLATISLVYIGLAMHLAPRMAALLLVCACGLAWAVRGTLEQARLSGKRASKSRARLQAAIGEHMASMKTAKSYGASDRHAESFKNLSHDLRDVSLEVNAGEADLQQSLEFGSTALLAFIVYVSFIVLEEPATKLLVLLFLFARLMPRLVTMYRQLQALAGVLPVFESVRQLEVECLAAAEHPVTPDADVPFTTSVCFDDVSFSYARRAATPAVDGVTLEIAAGMTTAIVGPSGSGKSTLADLLIGLLAPTTGRILVDGEPLTPARLQGWRQHISYVPQDTFLFHDSVRANLAWARPGATDEMMRHALRLAAADAFVDRLPRGLDTVVGERGVLVSGGERQRLSLARAILRQPRMLVLDEATSSLDSENELRIQEAIESLHQRMTIVIVTHRLSTIRHADLIHVVEGGRVVESGAWQELLDRRSGRFRAMCRAQGVADALEPARPDVEHEPVFAAQVESRSHA